MLHKIFIKSTCSTLIARKAIGGWQVVGGGFYSDDNVTVLFACNWAGNPV